MLYWDFTFAYKVNSRHLEPFPRMSLDDFVVKECRDKLIAETGAQLRDDIEALYDRASRAIRKRSVCYDLSGNPGILELPSNDFHRFAFCVQNAEPGAATVLSPIRIPSLEVVDKARERYLTPV